MPFIPVISSSGIESEIRKLNYLYECVLCYLARTRSDESSAANTPLTTRSLSLSATAVTNFTESDSSGAERRVLGHETLKLGAVPTPSFACDSVSVVAKSPSHHTSQDSHGNDPVGLGDAANSGQEAPKKTAANGNYSAKPSKDSVCISTKSIIYFNADVVGLL